MKTLDNIYLQWLLSTQSLLWTIMSLLFNTISKQNALTLGVDFCLQIVQC